MHHSQKETFSTMKCIIFTATLLVGLAVSAPNRNGYQSVATIDIRINPTNISRGSDTSDLGFFVNSVDVGGEMAERDDADLVEALAEEVTDLRRKSIAQADEIEKLRDDLYMMDVAVQELQKATGLAAGGDVIFTSPPDDSQKCNAVDALTDVACEKSVIGGKEWPSPKWYSPKNVLTDSCDDISDRHTLGRVDWWAAPDGATWDDAHFVVDLGCQKCVSQVVLRNSGNGRAMDRGTKEFLVSVSTESDPDNWTSVASGILEDVRDVDCDRQPDKKTIEFEPRLARFAKFEVESFYGMGAVLQHFDMN